MAPSKWTSIERPEGPGPGSAGLRRPLVGDPDRASHLADRPRFCPNCGNGVTGTEGISVEYWEADRRVFHTWCNTCGWSGNIVASSEWSATNRNTDPGCR